jgi:hypothetical protein
LGIDAREKLDRYFKNTYFVHVIGNEPFSNPLSVLLLDYIMVEEAVGTPTSPPI